MDDEAPLEQVAVEARGTTTALRVLDTSTDPSTALVILPAMGVPATAYETLARRLATPARSVVVTDLRGQGDSQVRVRRGIDFGYQDLVDGEVAATVEFAVDRWPDAAIALVGHSLGGQLGLLYAAAHPDQLDAVALPVAGTIHWRAYPGLFGPGVLAYTQLARLVASLSGVFPGDRLGFGGRQPATLIRDWANTAITGRWAPRGATVDYQTLLERLQLPVLSVTLAGDAFAPPAAAKALTGSVPGELVEHVHLGADELDGAVDHISWLREPGPVAARLTEWLDRHLDQTSAPATSSAHVPSPTNRNDSP